MVAKVKFRTSAGFYKEFLNYLCENNIPVMNVVYEQFGFTALCYAEDYRFIARAGKKFQVKVRLLEKKGLWFSFGFVLKRKGVLIGVATFLLLTYVFSLMVWDINLEITDETIKNEIITQLFAQNIYPGVFADKEKLNRAEKEILSVNNKLKYVSLNFYKGILNCQISFKTDKADYLAGLKDDNIYAQMSGIISDLRVYDGYSVVQLGQSVARGDMLVSSLHTDKHGNQYTSATRAYIEAICNKSYSVEIPFEKTVEILTGETDQEKTIYFMGYSKDIKCVDSMFKQSSIYKSYIDYCSFFGFHLPLTIKTTHYYKLRQVDIKNDSLTARKVAQLQLEHMIQNDEKLIKENSRQYEYILAKDCLTVYCHINGCYEIG